MARNRPAAYLNNRSLRPKRRWAGERPECVGSGIFAAVYSAFESWQVFRHSNLYAKLPTVAIHDRITCAFSILPWLPCPRDLRT
jgi:hypothetical protein